MVSLTDIQKSQARFHLGYHDGVPGGDRARLQKAVSELPDAWTQTRVGLILSRCESAYTLTQLTSGDVGVDEEVAVTGDVIRTTQTKNRPSYEKRYRYYLIETNSLALAFGVRNYRDPTQAINGYLTDGGVYINSIPGVAGDDGSRWITGIGVPSLGIGEVVGDLYLDTNTGNLFGKTDEVTWAFLLNLRGIAGSTWRTGFGVPTNGQFTEGLDDLYLDRNNGDYYKKTDSVTWTLQGNLKGGRGDTGLTGLQGIQGQTGLQGVKGDIGEPFTFDAVGLFSQRPSFDAQPEGFAFLATDQGNIYIKLSSISGDWSTAIAFKGDKGDTGATGSIADISVLELIQTTEPVTVVVNETWLYSKTNGSVYSKVNGGTESLVVTDKTVQNYVPLIQWVARPVGFTAVDADHGKSIKFNPTAAATITLPDTLTKNITFNVYLLAAFAVTYTVSGTATRVSDGSVQSVVGSVVNCSYDAVAKTWFVVGRLV